MLAVLEDGFRGTVLFRAVQSRGDCERKAGGAGQGGRGGTKVEEEEGAGQGGATEGREEAGTGEDEDWEQRSMKIGERGAAGGGILKFGRLDKIALSVLGLGSRSRSQSLLIVRM